MTFTCKMHVCTCCSCEVTMTENNCSSVVTYVEDALSSMLSRRLSLDKQLLAASKKILLQKIEFEPAQRTSSLYPLQKLRAKYTPLNAADAADKQTAGLT